MYQDLFLKVQIIYNNKLVYLFIYCGIVLFNQCPSSMVMTVVSGT